MPKRVCLVSPRSHLLDAARRLGLDAVCVFTPKEIRTIPADTIGDFVCLVLPYHDHPEAMVDAVRALHAGSPFSAAIAMQEEGLLAAARLNDALDLGGVGFGTVALLTDKWQMRQRLADRGLHPVAARIGSSVQDIADFAASAGYPVIAKPIAGSASIGVLRIESQDDLDAAREALSHLGLRRFLMEEYLDGPEISVDAISFGGRHVVVAIADKITGTNYVEFGHLIPANLDPELEAQVCRTVADFLDAVGLRDGLSHTEVKLTSRGPRVVEGHDRRGGDRITTLTDAVYGIDLEEYGLAWAAGEAQPLTERPTGHGGAAVIFYEAEPGRLIAVENADEVRNHPAVREFHVNFALGDVIPRVRWSLDRAGYLVATADSSRAAWALANDLASTLRFVTEPVAGASADDDLEAHRSLVAELDQADRLSR